MYVLVTFEIHCIKTFRSVSFSRYSVITVTTKMETVTVEPNTLLLVEESQHLYLLWLRGQIRRHVYGAVTRMKQDRTRSVCLIPWHYIIRDKMLSKR